MTPTFKDKKGTVWNLEFVAGDLERVRKKVTNKDGEPIDLTLMAEKGDFRSVTNDINIFPTVIFWLVIDQITDLFSEAQYDKEQADYYKLDPDARTLPPLQKAANWFGDRLDGNTITAMADAFEVAVINFTRIPIREKLTKLMRLQKDLEQAILDKTIAEKEKQLKAGLNAVVLSRGRRSA